MAESNAVLDEFFAGLDSVASAEGPEGVLRWTGEELAKASDRLAKSAAERRESAAAELLVIAHAHVDALSQAEMAPDALATQIIAMLSVLNAKVNPESFPSLWLQSLQALCLKASEFVYMEQRQPMQASQIAAQIFGLFIATAHDFMPRYGASESMRRFYDHMRDMRNASGEELSHFQGHIIVPTLAIDILADSAARLASMGYID